ncbi:MAG: lipopolysaccharide kinase InaA family protein [Pseudomonadales bacterium]|nr:lipopolysaccharide kinase InaA family protein [Pseudomonadales bacterium]
MSSQSPAQTVAATDLFRFWWQLPGEWVEPPNIRRGGWSGVKLSHWQNHTLYIKRQSRHLCRDWRHPLGWPTLCREHSNLQQLRTLGIGCPTPLFSGRLGNSAILVLEALEGFTALDQLSLATSASRESLARSLGESLGRLHRHCLQHSSLYAKHVFVRPQADQWQIALIDLEKMRRCISAKFCARHDLSQLRRHQNLFDSRDWDVLLEAHEQNFSVTF